MKKSFVLGLLLSILLLPGLAFAEQRSHFPDAEPDAWFTPYVEQAVREGLMEGYPDGRFGSWDAMNRAEFAKVIVTLKSQLQTHWLKDNWVEILLVIITLMGWKSILGSMRQLVEQNGALKAQHHGHDEKPKKNLANANVIEKNLKSNWWVD